MEDAIKSLDVVNAILSKVESQESLCAKCVQMHALFYDEFTKYINNDGRLTKYVDEVLLKKAECLAHFSHQKYNGNLLLLDIQGFR